MATLLSALETQARRHLLETTAKFWTSAEMVDILNHGIWDLWRAINDLHQEHFLTIDATNVSLAADAYTLTGVPADTYRVHLIEPRDLTSTGAARSLRFMPLDYNHPDFQYARSLPSQDANGVLVYYNIINAGAPVAAPTVRVAPALTSAVNLAFIYVPTIAALTASGTNPIPGESDEALVAWTVAWARAKEREDRAPDGEWLAVYATLKQGLLMSLTPRQTQEPEVVEALFQDFWS